jgi:hypothetical protein
MSFKQFTQSRDLSVKEVADIYKDKYQEEMAYSDLLDDLKQIEAQMKKEEIFKSAKKKQKKKSGIATKTNPSLWAKCKSEAKSRMGGKHSARAMQLATKLYKQRGGGYRGKKPTARTNKMKKWTKQKWMYLSDYKKKSKKKDKNKANDILLDSNDAKGRYLPEKKWRSLTPKQRKATDQKKKRSKKPIVPNTEAAKVRSKNKYY